MMLLKSIRVMVIKLLFLPEMNMGLGLVEIGLPKDLSCKGLKL